MTNGHRASSRRYDRRAEFCCAGACLVMDVSGCWWRSTVRQGPSRAVPGRPGCRGIRVVIVTRVRPRSQGRCAAARRTNDKAPGQNAWISWCAGAGRMPPARPDRPCFPPDRGRVVTIALLCSQQGVHGLPVEGVRAVRVQGVGGENDQATWTERVTRVRESALPGLRDMAVQRLVTVEGSSPLMSRCPNASAVPPTGGAG